jgi:hypothetical protein
MLLLHPQNERVFGTYLENGEEKLRHRAGIRSYLGMPQLYCDTSGSDAASRYAEHDCTEDDSSSTGEPPPTDA